MIATPISIVLTDNYAPLRRLIKAYLSANGFDVMCEAGNGRDLLNKLCEAPRLPDMCLLNINMPIMDGYETAAQLTKQYPGICIMAFSFHDDETKVRRIFDSGAHGFICKDTSPDELRDALVDLYTRFQGANPYCPTMYNQQNLV